MESRQRERESKQDGRWMSFGSVCVCALNVYRAVWAIVNLVWDPLFSLIPFWLAGCCWRIYIPLFLAVQFSTWKCSRCFPTRKDNRLYTKIPSSQKVRRGEKEKKKKKQELWGYGISRSPSYPSSTADGTIGARVFNSILTGHKRPFFFFPL